MKTGAKLVMLQTGGTLVMRSTGEGKLEVSEGVRDIVGEDPALGRIAEWETEAVMALDSGDMQPSHWIELGKRVHAALARSDVKGVVIVHGTDTMAYTASALALLFGAIPKPVVLTGAQRPLDETLTDARANLESAALVATLDVPEVLIAFGGHAFRGVRSTKKDAWSYEAFDSPNLAPLVSFGVDVTVGSHVRAPGALLPFDARIEPKVLAVRVFPGLDPGLVRGALRAGVKGLVLEAYGSGNLPHTSGSLLPVLTEAQERGIPVFVVSQCFRGRAELGRYGGSATAKSMGAVAAGDMTAEAALVKMMIGIGRHGNGPELRAFLESDIAGERTT